MTWYRYESNILILRFYVQPGAKKHAIVGLIADELKIKLSTPPIEGRANQELIKLLSKSFKVPKSNIRLKSGDKSRHKCIEITGTNINPENFILSSVE